MKLKELFDKHEDEFLKFDRVENKRSSYRDVHAFMLLAELDPYAEGEGSGDMVSCAEHDEIWLAVPVEKLAAVATEAQIIELIRCGVRFDNNVESLAMFV